MCGRLRSGLVGLATRSSMGAATVLDVFISQSEEDQASTDRVTARYDDLLARAELEAILGRDL